MEEGREGGREGGRLRGSSCVYTHIETPEHALLDHVEARLTEFCCADGMHSAKNVTRKFPDLAATEWMVYNKPVAETETPREHGACGHERRFGGRRRVQSCFEP